MGIDLGYKTPDSCRHVCRAYRAGIVGLGEALDVIAFRRNYRHPWGREVCECEAPRYILDVATMGVMGRAA